MQLADFTDLQEYTLCSICGGAGGWFTEDSTWLDCDDCDDFEEA